MGGSTLYNKSKEKRTKQTNLEIADVKTKIFNY